MYTAIVRRIVRTGFRALSAGDYEQVLRQFHPGVIFSFSRSYCREFPGQPGA